MVKDLISGQINTHHSRAINPLLTRWMGESADGEPILTNQPGANQSFQRWFKFKEAFSPEFINQCINASETKVTSCLDPFGGSGTTALTCQFRGIKPSTIEVNPFLADLIESKLVKYNLKDLLADYIWVVDKAIAWKLKAGFPAGLPKTFIEPGFKDRWLFGKDAAAGVFCLLDAIDQLGSVRNQRLLKALLGAQLVRLSNVIVNGKGRRYRGNWSQKKDSASDVLVAFSCAFKEAYEDISNYSSRACSDYSIYRGDSRVKLRDVEETDLVIFSPPYPNSFDYTDIYNVELWMLGYLTDSESNTVLRNKTIRSHVQVKRDYGVVGELSKELLRVGKKLDKCRDDLWSRDIPDMVGAYFDDMRKILEQLRLKCHRNTNIFMAVGNSKYSGVLVNVAKILCEVADSIGYDVISSKPIRSMRSSAQQGGRKELAESVIRLRRRFP